MVRVTEVSGVEWIEPNHIKVSDLLAKIKDGESVDQVKSSLGISDQNHWITVAEAIFAQWKQGAAHPDGNDQLVAQVNQRLAPYALSFPVYGIRPEADHLNKILSASQPDIDAATKVVFSAVMQPRMRALQLVGRFQKIPLFAEFAYFIDSARLAYY